MSAYWTGRKRDANFCAAASRATVKRYEAGVYRTEGTAPERAVAAMLDSIGVAYETQRGIGGRYVVDFFVPSLNLVIEADGDYWHAHPAKYSPDSLNEAQQKKVRRDRKLEALLIRRGWPIVRFWECDLHADPHGCEQRLRAEIARLS